MNHTIRIIVNIVLSLLLLVVAAGVGRWLISHMQTPERQAPARPAPRVQAPPIEPAADYQVELVGFGSARARVRQQVTPRVSGEIVDKAPNFLSGKYVQAGQMLLEIDRTDYQLAYDRVSERIALLEAQAARIRRERENLRDSRAIEAQRLELARSQEQRVLALIARGASSENELDAVRETLLARQAQLQSIDNSLALIEPQLAELQAQIDQAHVDQAEAQVALDRCTILSPVSGRVLSSSVEIGEQVSMDTPCGEVYATAVMEVPVSIPASDLAWLDPQMLEQCRRGGALPHDPDRRIGATVQWSQSSQSTGAAVVWRGCVDRIEAGLEAQTRTAVLVVRVDNPALVFGDDPAAPTMADEPMLDLNMFCRVVIYGRQIDRAFVLPRSAVRPDGTVYMVAQDTPGGANPGPGGDETWRLIRRPVRVARYAGEQAMILPGGGIEPGDRVVTTPPAKPVVGMEVVPADVVGPTTAPAAAEVGR